MVEIRLIFFAHGLRLQLPANRQDVIASFAENVSLCERTGSWTWP